MFLVGYQSSHWLTYIFRFGNIKMKFSSKSQHFYLEIYVAAEGIVHAGEYQKQIFQVWKS
jgi:hypothetical protein